MLSGLLYGRIPIIATATTIREIMIMCAGDVYRMVLFLCSSVSFMFYGDTLNNEHICTFNSYCSNLSGQTVQASTPEHSDSTPEQETFLRCKQLILSSIWNNFRNAPAVDRFRECQKLLILMSFFGLSFIIWHIRVVNDSGTSGSDSNSVSTRVDSNSDSNSRVFQNPRFRFQFRFQ